MKRNYSQEILSYFIIIFQTSKKKFPPHLLKILIFAFAALVVTGMKHPFRGRGWLQGRCDPFPALSEAKQVLSPVLGFSGASLKLSQV